MVVLEVRFCAQVRCHGNNFSSVPDSVVCTHRHPERIWICARGRRLTVTRFWLVSGRWIYGSQGVIALLLDLVSRNTQERQNKIAERSQVEQSTIWFAAIRMCCNAAVNSQAPSIQDVIEIGWLDTHLKPVTRLLIESLMTKTSCTPSEVILPKPKARTLTVPPARVIQ